MKNILSCGFPFPFIHLIYLSKMTYCKSHIHVSSMAFDQRCSKKHLSRNHTFDFKLSVSLTCVFCLYAIVGVIQEKLWHLPQKKLMINIMRAADAICYIIRQAFARTWKSWVDSFKLNYSEFMQTCVSSFKSLNKPWQVHAVICQPAFPNEKVIIIMDSNICSKVN